MIAIKTTKKQKDAFKEVLKGENVTTAMKKAGYSPMTIKKTANLTKSKGWQELMDTELPDTLLTRVHKQGLKATKKEFKNNNATGKIEVVSEEPDYAVRHKYLDTAYKIKNKFPKEGLGVAVQINVNSDKEQFA